MYLAEYDIGGTMHVQAAAGLTYPRHPDGDPPPAWWSRFKSVVRSLAAVPGAAVSLRLRGDPDVTAACFATAPASDAAALRRAFGSFTQLDVLGDGDVVLAQNRDEHDRLLQFPRYQCRAAVQSLVRQSVWFAFDFRVHDRLNDLFLEARTLGHALSYHVTVERLTMDPEWLRAASRNAVRVASLSGVPAPIAQRQQDLADRLRRATHVCEEILGVETPDAAAWLTGSLTRRFCEAHGPSVDPGFLVEDGGNDGSLVATRHKVSFESIGVDEVCGSAITEDDGIRLLTWSPVRTLLADAPALESDRTEVPATPARLLDYSGMPSPYDGKEPYAFISYKREDLGRLKGLVAELGRRGQRVWYDKGIPGGAEWDALIEERVQHCQVLLLFLSQAAVHSKWVRREVKFADSLSKPIISVRLERDIELAHGLSMLLHQYQMIDVAPDVLPDEIERAVKFVRLV